MSRNAEVYTNMMLHQQRARLAAQSEVQRAYLAATEPPVDPADTKPLPLPDMDAAKDFPPLPLPDGDACPICSTICTNVGSNQWHCERCGSNWLVQGRIVTLAGNTSVTKPQKG